ncbi:hypothetical protein [Azospirillum sp. TSO22-1]|uniref:hypothetical protein n=1 Tax=Azospirillum sp. TSO22-1 TaxID=716789 RepID=UPI000D615F2A|nr:hypothetical protein [Azospirillum sp. TSO22-1]PWC56217.1 hypothetical protein TSO221_02370 [Azospirillum sp. TSO22-1]
MKAKIAIVAAATAAFFLTQAPAFAGDQDFEVVNKTGYPIKHLHVSEANNNSWEEDVLGRDVLNDGESFELKFAKGEKTCKWDMKVAYDDGETAVWQALNLCKISKVTLRWNKSTGETTAAID